MARKILCTACERDLREIVTSTKELIESVAGVAIKRMKCDDCGKDLPEKSICHATLLLPSKAHHNYEKDKPSRWCREYIDPRP